MFVCFFLLIIFNERTEKEKQIKKTCSKPINCV